MKRRKLGSTGRQQANVRRTNRQSPQPLALEVTTWDPVEGSLERDQDTQSSRKPTSPLVFDEELLECAQTQWQFGDWEGLISLDYDTIEGHPDRAKLALLAGIAHLQLGHQPEARILLNYASDWGCPRNLIAQHLISGVHNSLAKASAIMGEEERALSHFESAVSAAMPRGAANLLLAARTCMQLAQISSPAAKTGMLSGVWREVSKTPPLKSSHDRTENDANDKISHKTTQTT